MQHTIQRKELWQRYFKLGTDLIETIKALITFDAGDPCFGKIFQINFNRYEEDSDCFFIGVKLIDGDIQLLEKSSKGYCWLPVKEDEIEYPSSPSRLDILIWLVDELETNHEKADKWITDYLTDVPANTSPHTETTITNFWQDFHKTARDYFNKIISYFPDDPKNKHFGEIFKIELYRYSEDMEDTILGLKRFDQKLFALIQDGPCSKRWFYIDPENAEHTESPARIDLLVWMHFLLLLNSKNPKHWIKDRTGIVPKKLGESHK